MKTIIKTLLFILMVIFLSQCEKEESLSVNTGEITSVTAGGTYCYGWIYPEGEGNFIEYGFVWSTSNNPDIQGYKEALLYKTYFEKGIYFETQISGLSPNTSYFVRAYATNKEGTFYGKEKKITTSRIGTFTDIRDGITYKWVEIGNQVWMAENLAYIPYVCSISSDSGIFVYNYFGSSVDEAKGTNEYNTFGCLYSWEVAYDVCPSGWHVPSDDEWIEMEVYLGMSYRDAHDWGFRGAHQGGLLKYVSHWNSPNVGANNSSNFSALPAGRCNSDPPYFSGLGGATYFLTPMVHYVGVRTRSLHRFSSQINRTGTYHEKGWSIRCIKDK